jgi:predicted cation transporter
MFILASLNLLLIESMHPVAPAVVTNLASSDIRYSYGALSSVMDGAVEAKAKTINNIFSLSLNVIILALVFSVSAIS